VKDSQGNSVRGRTKWWRFAAVVVPATVAVSGMMGGIASGIVPVALNVSGQTAKITADKLDGKGFHQYGAVVVTKNGQKIPVAASAIKSAKLYNLCQSVAVPGTPLALILRAGQQEGKPAEATDLLIGMDYLSGNATFGNINIGTDASVLKQGGDFVGSEGDFGQEASTVVIDDLKQRFYSTHAGVFKLTGLTLSIQANKECFGDPVIN